MSARSKSLFTAETNHHYAANTSWPEWKDSDLNNEKWGTPKDGLFLDTEPVKMPGTLEPYQWLRAKDLEYITTEPNRLIIYYFTNIKRRLFQDLLTVYTLTDEYSDLISNNKHLLHSEFVRCFISALTNLQYCGREGLEISGEGSNFAWVSRREPWHGWMHVYSLNKAGKGVQHRPVINPNGKYIKFSKLFFGDSHRKIVNSIVINCKIINRKGFVISINVTSDARQYFPGKYIVRLHHMGSWRSIVVDDTIPVDKNGTPLLPRTSNNIELWPMLLAKALLKVASLTWTERREIIDFHLISCLTGWTCLTLNIAHLSWQDKWDFLTKYSDHFVWSPRTVEDHVPESSESAINNTANPNETLQLLVQAGKPQPITLFLQLRNMRELENNMVPGLSPCWDHVIHVVQSRDIPLDPKDVKPPLARWKLHRWLKWAISRGIIEPADYFVPIRYLRIISPLQKCNGSLTYVHDDVENNLILPGEIGQSDKAKRKMKSSDTKNSLTTTKDEKTGDISRWIDFNEMAPYVTEVHLFYKLEYFQCSIQVINETLKLNNKNHEATIAKKKKKGKEENVDRSRKIQKSRYKPLYLFCDSPEKKFFLISLCAAPNKKNTLCKRDYLILEKYNWFFGPNRLDQSVTIRTTGIKSTVMEMEAGRQLLRIDGSPEFSLAIISSDTAFHLGNQPTVQQLMTTESRRTEQMSKTISDSLRKAYQSFGTEDYPTMLKNYYQSYMPSSQNVISREDKRFLRTLIHDFFMEEQVRLIKKTLPDKDHRNILYSMRVFFLNSNIRLKYFNLIETQDGRQDLTTEQTSRISYSRRSDREILDRAATKIQSFFKMVLIKLYKYRHNSDNAQYARIREELLRISDLFDLSTTSQLLRNVIKRHDKLRDFYPCSKDFVHVLNFQEFKGASGSIKYDRWIPIARIVVTPRSSETVFAAFELLVDLPRFTLRVFNNQSQREMTRLINRVTPGHYGHHPTGYTVFAYGWSDKQRFKEINWTIRIVTMKGEPILYQLNEQWILSLETKPLSLIVEELAAVYVPNAKNCISSWILRATSGSMISMKLTTSYDMVEVGVRLTDEEGNVLINVNGGSTILLPLVILDQPAANRDHHEVKVGSAVVNKEFENAVEEKKLYYVEAYVRNNSWPLTEVEWAVVNRIKIKDREDFTRKMQFENKIPSASNFAKTASKDPEYSVNDDQVLKPPYWILQVVTYTRDAVEICQDKKREQEIALLKETWRSKDPSQSERGRKLRESFLNTHIMKTESIVSSEQKEESNTIETKDIAFPQMHEKQRRTLKSPESYHLTTLDLTKYMMRNEIVTDYYVRMESDYQILRHQHTVNVTDSQKNYSQYLDNLAKLMNKQLRGYAKLLNKKEESFWQRRALVDDAYESKKVYIDTLTFPKTKTKKNKPIN